jgi:hypothetical protein
MDKKFISMSDYLDLPTLCISLTSLMASELPQGENTPFHGEYISQQVGLTSRLLRLRKTLMAYDQSVKYLSRGAATRPGCLRVAAGL